MTAVGLLMRLYSGWRTDHPDFIRGTDYLAANLPAYGTTEDRQRDTYYWYYATQVMLQRGGEPWEIWREHLFPLLCETQIKQGALAGSWDPLRPVRQMGGTRRENLCDREPIVVGRQNHCFSLYEQ
jgi:hypothetical protein